MPVSPQGEGLTEAAAATAPSRATRRSSAPEPMPRRERGPFDGAGEPAPALGRGRAGEEASPSPRRSRRVEQAPRGPDRRPTRSREPCPGPIKQIGSIVQRTGAEGISGRGSGDRPRGKRFSITQPAIVVGEARPPLFSGASRAIPGPRAPKPRSRASPLTAAISALFVAWTRSRATATCLP
jgi:hypothetical protein